MDLLAVVGSVNLDVCVLVCTVRNPPIFPLFSLELLIFLASILYYYSTREVVVLRIQKHLCVCSF